MGSWLEKPAAPKGNDIRTPQTLEVCGKISHIWLSYAGPGVVEQIFAGVTLAEGDSFEHVQWWPAGSRPRTRRGAGGKFVHVTAPERIYLLTVAQKVSSCGRTFITPVLRRRKCWRS